jgi:hypothetical protein
MHFVLVVFCVKVNLDYSKESIEPEVESQQKSFTCNERQRESELAYKACQDLQLSFSQTIPPVNFRPVLIIQ